MITIEDNPNWYIEGTPTTSGLHAIKFNSDTAQNEWLPLAKAATKRTTTKAIEDK